MLNLKVSIIVPSKDKNGVEINHESLLHEVLTDLIKMCGGAYIESQNNQGGFLMSNGSIMFERNSIVTTFTKQENLDSFKLGQYLIDLKNKANQEALAYIINHTLYLI
jgi:exopolysaccharide biosynthesis protein